MLFNKEYNDIFNLSLFFQNINSLNEIQYNMHI